jgi:hypothetical protein
MTSKESGVLQAAMEWGAALEVRSKADEELSGQREADEAFAKTEVDLYAAVLAWRSQSPQGPMEKG